MARRLWLSKQELIRTPTGKIELESTIKRLGYVQIDSIQNVARAHHHILWSRNQNYREKMLDQMLRVDRSIFEHFTHDASVIPTDFYPYWHRQFDRQKKRIKSASWFKKLPGPAGRRKILNRIESEGPLSSNDFKSRITGTREMWSRPPHKLALDYMWYAGDLATSHRKGFTKFYDLAERVIPSAIQQTEVSDNEQLDWLCRGALTRLGFASPGDIQRFWEAATLPEVKAWVDANASNVTEIEVQTSNGDWFRQYAPKEIEEEVANLGNASSRLRILNPFDPLIRNRKRLQQLFGFEYRIEIFVPAAKRQWGYYIYPLLEGERFVGRIELKADRKSGTLELAHLWPEQKIVWNATRAAKLDAELARFARFAGLAYAGDDPLNALVRNR